MARDVDGTLRTGTLDEQRRMRQIYFPVAGRELIMPKMFEENQLEVRRRVNPHDSCLHRYLQKVLERADYEFILDRASAQFEPDDQDYLRVSQRYFLVDVGHARERLARSLTEPMNTWRKRIRTTRYVQRDTSVQWRSISFGSNESIGFSTI